MLLKEDILTIEAILGYQFKDRALLDTAFTHSSYANIKNVQSNERLEFLGDTLLSTVISEKIYLDKDYNEGELSRLRSRIVSMEPLANLIEELSLSKYLQYVGALTSNMKADLMEAIIAAIYIDGGMVKTKKFISKTFGETVKSMESLTCLADPKSRLQELLNGSEIKYTCSKSGSDHNPSFLATCIIGGVVCGRGEGSSKKAAEKNAAQEAIKKLNKV